MCDVKRFITQPGRRFHGLPSSRTAETDNADRPSAGANLAMRSPCKQDRECPHNKKRKTLLLIAESAAGLGQGSLRMAKQRLWVPAIYNAHSYHERPVFLIRRRAHRIVRALKRLSKAASAATGRPLPRHHGAVPPHRIYIERDVRCSPVVCPDEYGLERAGVVSSWRCEP